MPDNTDATPDEWAEIHRAIGLVGPTAGLEHPPLEMVPTSAMGGAGGRMYNDPVYGPTRYPSPETFNNAPSEYQHAYITGQMMRTPYDQNPYTYARQHMENLLGGSGAWQDYLNSTRGLTSAMDETASRWMDRRSSDTQPSLSDRAIAQHLQQNPGASIFDVAGHEGLGESQDFLQRAEAELRRPGRQVTSPDPYVSTPLGDFPSSVAKAFEQHLGSDLQAFKDRFFNGYGQGLSSVYYPDDKSMHFTGALRDPQTGNRVGSIERSINPTTGEAYHGLLDIEPEYRGTGIVPQMLKNQVEQYQKMGLDHVSLQAGLDVGPYAWAKYGFLPSSSYEWDSLRGRIKQAVGRTPDLDPEQADAIKKLADSPDPHALWDISDIKAPFGTPFTNAKGQQTQQTVGQAILRRSGGWKAKLDLTDEDSMERFNDYVSSKGAK